MKTLIGLAMVLLASSCTGGDIDKSIANSTISGKSGSVSNYRFEVSTTGALVYEGTVTWNLGLVDEITSFTGANRPLNNTSEYVQHDGKNSTATFENKNGVSMTVTVYKDGVPVSSQTETRMNFSVLFSL